MMNKLIFGRELILKPLYESLKKQSVNRKLQKIEELQNQISETARQRDTITKMFTQGIIDAAVYNQQNFGSLSEIARLETEIGYLQADTSDDMTRIKKLSELLHFAENSGMLTEFDDTLFVQTVSSITVLTRHELEFHLRCGLSLREKV